MSRSADKRALVETFFQQIEKLEATPGVSSYSSVGSENEIKKVLKAVPSDWEPPFVARLYYESLKKLGIRAELKSVKPEHYPSMVKGFETIASHLGTDKAGLVHRIEMLILWENGAPGSVPQQRFARNLAFVLKANGFTNIPGLAKSRDAFDAFASDAELTSIGRDVLGRVEREGGCNSLELFCYWGLVYLQLLERSSDSEKFLDAFLASKDAPDARRRVFLVNRFILANKKDPYFAALNDRLRNKYPDAWLDEYHA